MSVNNIYGVILAGGIGTRFWPASKKTKPKQFLDLLNIGHSLLQMTHRRNLSIIPQEQIFVTTNEAYIQLVREQLPQLPMNQLVIEPIRKSTAPCVLHALLKINKLNPNACVVICPSEHNITFEDKYSESVLQACEYATSNPSLVVLGIKPHRPDINCCYVQYYTDNAEEEETDSTRGEGTIFATKTFVEYPTEEIVDFFWKSNEFLWSTDIIVGRVDVFLNAYKTHLPDMYNLFLRGEEDYNTEYETEFTQRIYSSVEQIRVKKGILHVAKNVKVLWAKFGWARFNTWNSLWETHPKDKNENTTNGTSVVMYDSRNCVVHASKGKLVIVQGLENHIVVDSENALLICKRSEEHRLNHMLNLIKRTKGEEFL